MKPLLHQIIRRPGTRLTLLLAILLGSLTPSVKSVNLDDPQLPKPSKRTASTTLIISEVLYDPSGTEPDGEWIELYNLGTDSINLADHKLGDEEVFGGEEGMVRFPSGAVIHPGQAVVIAGRATAFFTAYGFAPDYEIFESSPAVPNMEHYGVWAGGSVALHNDGDDVLLLNAGNDVVDALSWGTSTFAFNPPIPDVVQGRSLERRPANKDTDTASDWINQSSPDPGHVVVNLEVVSTSDSGPGTLRWALFNTAAGDTITFSTSVFPPHAPATIFAISALPTLTQNNVTMDASNTGVILDGSGVQGDVKGLVIEADDCVIQGLTIRDFPNDGISILAGASNNTIGGDRNVGEGPNGQGNLIISNGTTGIEILGDNNFVQGNYIGIDASGMWDAGNAFNGVAIWNGASGNTVGGTNTGHRNVIGGNDQNGVWIEGVGTEQNVIIGNYVGTRANGLKPVANGFSGVAIQGGAQNNTVGGTIDGAGNLISGNVDTGVYISDLGTDNNLIWGNIIGANWQGTSVIGQGRHGVAIVLGASKNEIGDGSEGGRNLISGNAASGVHIAGADTMSNTVQGNYIGTNISGTAALPNRMHGVELNINTHDNVVGGNRLTGEGNLISGNRNHGLVITEGAHHNTIAGNIMGPDATGTYSLGNHPFGAIDITNGAHDNVIGGLDPGEGNLISGNQTDGIALFDNTEKDSTAGNQILGNRIGLALNDDSPLSNGKFGILNAFGAINTQIISNTVAHHYYHGVLVATCEGNTLSQNSVYSNTLEGIKLEDNCLNAPQITGTSIGSTETVTGTTVPHARVELFSDGDDEGQIYEGFTTADESGFFVFSRPGGFVGPNVTATSTDAGGNTSQFSRPAHLLWTLLLYLNGDNDLEEYMFDTVDNIAAAGPSSRANVLALVDGFTTTAAYSGTILYDLTWGAATPLTSSVTLTGERNMGDGQTLVSFVNWGQAYYPARYTLLAIADHGGGWAPSPINVETGAALPFPRAWKGGSSGLSWDFTDGYDYLESPEIRQAMAAMTDSGAKPLDVVFYDVCLMGLLEVAYQIQEYATYFVSSQNIAWAPIGPQGYYVRLVHEIRPTTTPRQLAELAAETYAASLPPELHPFTISAVDLTKLPTVTSAANQLAIAISNTLTNPLRTLPLYAAYSTTQKLDYDSNFAIEPATDGFVDLYDFAMSASQQFTDANVITAAHIVTSALNTVVITEHHRSGTSWIVPTQTWELNDVHGLSIFLPLGEELELRIPISETPPFSGTVVLTRNLRLRETYSCDQLQFVCDTAWDALIDTYYSLISTPVPTSTTGGPVHGLQPADVTPPQTTITVTGEPHLDQVVDVTWTATDSQTGVAGATLWHRPPHGDWATVSTKSASAGVFSFTLSEWCGNSFAVQATDKAGNVEPLESKTNTVTIMVQPCHQLFLPLIWREDDL